MEERKRRKFGRKRRRRRKKKGNLAATLRNFHSKYDRDIDET